MPSFPIRHRYVCYVCPVASRILVIGGTGVLGSRIVRLLAAVPRVELLFTSREAARAATEERVLATEGVEARAICWRGEGGAAALLARTRPDLMIDATGSLSGLEPSLAMSRLRLGIAYIDLSPSRLHIRQTRELDAMAVAAGVPVLTGAGLLPSVSMAAASTMAREMTEVSALRVFVCPGNQEARGRAFLQTLMASAGRPFRHLRDGVWTTGRNWLDLRRLDLPGVWADAGPVRRLFASIDAPDHDLMPEHWPDIATTSVQGGMELGLMQVGLWGAAWLRRLGLVRNPAWFSGLAADVGGLFRSFGTARSAFRVELEGSIGAHRVRRLWQIEGDEGEFAWVAAAPAAALARLVVVGPRPAPGARAAAGEPLLHEIVAELRSRQLRVRTLDLDA